MKKKMVMVAMVTPFDECHRIDDQAVIRLCHHLLKMNVDGLVVCGTTGEVSALTFEEREHLFKLVKNTVGKKAAVWMGCGTNNTDTTLKNCWQAESLGADGVMLITPYYVRPSQRGLYEHFSCIASRISLPIMLYNVPKRTGIHMEAKTIIDLAHTYPNIVMLKQAHKDCDEILRIASHTSLKLLCGDDFWYDEALEWGMDGIVSVAGHMDCEMIHLMNSYYQIGIRSEKLIERWKQLSRMCFLVSSPSDIKYMLMKKGICTQEVRLPLVCLNEEEKHRIDEYLEQFE